MLPLLPRCSAILRGDEVDGTLSILRFRCLNRSEQIGQKLHACTELYSQRRARDVLDILLIDLLGKLDITAVRATAEQVFTQRATHDFPPSIRIPAEWQPELRA